MPTPSTTQLAQPQVTLIVDWLIESVRSALADHEDGTFTSSGLLAESLPRNPRIRGAIDTRANGVTSLPFSIEPAASDARSQALADEISELWFDICPEQLTAEFLHWTILLGFCAVQVTWAKVEKRWLPSLRTWHPTHCYVDRRNESWWTYLQSSAPIQIRPGDGRWILVSYSRHRAWMQGVVRCLGIEDSLRSYVVRDWARWSEKHGLPIIGAKIPMSQIGTKSAEHFFLSLRKMGREGVIKLPQGQGEGNSFEAEYLEPKGAGWDGFRQLIATCDTDISIAILGQNLTTEVRGGSYAAAAIHEQVRQDYVKADTQALSTALREQLLKLYVIYNYGREYVDATPWPSWNATRPDDLGKKASEFFTVAQAIEKLVTVSPEIDVKAILQQFNVPLKSK